MTEREPKLPYRIPIEEDYEAATDVVDILFNEKNGPWNYYHKTSLLDAHRKASTRELFMAMASQARLVEPIENDQFQPIDPMFRATHAFLAGMWTGGFVSQELHQGLIGYSAVHNAIAAALPHQESTSQEEYEENGRMLLSIGDEGLNRVGFAAREAFVRWGSEIVSEESVRRYYALGAGAVLYSAHELYIKIHAELQLQYDVAQLDNEVSAYLASVHDSSDN